MFKHGLQSLIAAITVLGCGANTVQNSKENSPAEETASGEIPQRQIALNQFRNDGFVLKADGEVVQGKENIAQLYRDLFDSEKFRKVEIIHKAEGTESDNYYYEMGRYVFEWVTFAFLCKWERQNDDKWQKVFEAIAQVSNDKVDSAGVEACKSNIIEISREKDNALTIAALYRPDGYYFSKNTLVQGRPDIASAWVPGVQFEKLEALAYVQPKTDLLYEIGKYTVPGFSGLYILVWKENDGVWKVLLDSNV